MPQKEIELILARQLAAYLATSIFIVDPAGTLLYYNEEAERLIGRRFDESGELSAPEWSTVFKQSDADGNPIPRETLPLMIALTEHRPAQREMWILGLDGVSHHIQVTAIPVIGHAGRFLGAIAILWEQAGP